MEIIAIAGSYYYNVTGLDDWDNIPIAWKNY